MKQRLERINELIHKIVGQSLQRLFPQSHLTITKVDVSPDLRYADISISQLPYAGTQTTNILDAVADQKKEIQRVLGRSLKTKFTPRLRFHLDAGNQKAQRVDELLRKIRSDN